MRTTRSLVITRRRRHRRRHMCWWLPLIANATDTVLHGRRRAAAIKGRCRHRRGHLRRQWLPLIAQWHGERRSKGAGGGGRHPTCNMAAAAAIKGRCRHWRGHLHRWWRWLPLIAQQHGEWPSKERRSLCNMAAAAAIKGRKRHCHGHLHWRLALIAAVSPLPPWSRWRENKRGLCASSRQRQLVLAVGSCPAQPPTRPSLAAAGLLIRRTVTGGAHTHGVLRSARQ